MCRTIRRDGATTPRGSPDHRHRGIAVRKVCSAASQVCFTTDLLLLLRTGRRRGTRSWIAARLARSIATTA